MFGSALSVDPAAGAPGGLRWWFVVAAIMGILNAAVAAAYYLRIVAVMYFRTPLATPRADGGQGARWAAVICALAVVAAGVYPGPLMRQTETAGHGQGDVAAAKPQMDAVESPMANKRPPLQSAPDLEWR